MNRTGMRQPAGTRGTPSSEKLARGALSMAQAISTSASAAAITIVVVPSASEAANKTFTEPSKLG